MGIRNLLKELPGGSMADDTVHGFDKIDINNHKEIDAGGLVFVSAIRHKAAFNTGNYQPSIEDFQRQILLLNVIHQWNYTIVFDGPRPAEKEHEHRRRSEKEDTVEITSTFIAMCVKVCQRLFVKYVVGHKEADMQVGRRDNNSVVVCRDGDSVAYGHKLIIFVDNWRKEECRIINMNTELTEEIATKYPLYRYYCLYGIKVIHWWAAVMGCDVSQNASGIAYAGREAFIASLDHFDHIGINPSSTQFAIELRKNARPATRTNYSAQQIHTELDRVHKWYTKDGTFYDYDGNVMSISGRKISNTSIKNRHHMKGNLDPRSCQPFTNEQQKAIDSVMPHNVLHNSQVDKEQINGLSLPEGCTTLKDCSVEQLKAMLIARGGSVTKDGKSMNKPELIKTVGAYLLMESTNKQNTVYFNRTRKNNGIFAKIDSSERRSVKQILYSLQSCTEFEQGMRDYFSELLQLHNDGKFTDDFDTISLTAPELTYDFIRQSFAHVGDGISQKNIRSGLHKVLELDKVLYHAMARSDDNKYMYILSKQRASQTHDEKTRNKTAPGEKPKFAEYLVMLQIYIIPTTIESHGHCLGICGHVVRSYCSACKAGYGFCCHRSSSLWMQHLHWGEGRPTEKPPTSQFCSWFPGSDGRGIRACSVLEPALCIQRERLPGSNEEAAAKTKRGIKKSMHDGIPAEYDVFGGDKTKHALLVSPRYTDKSRIAPLFLALSEAWQNLSDDDSE